VVRVLSVHVSERVRVRVSECVLVREIVRVRAVGLGFFFPGRRRGQCVAVCSNVMRCVTVCYSVLHCMTVCCSVQHSVLLCVAVCYRVRCSVLCVCVSACVRVCVSVDLCVCAMS